MTSPTPMDRPVAWAQRPSSSFDPGAALAALDGLSARLPAPGPAGTRDAHRDAARDAAWDAAWIACTTNSPRWAEAARLEFVRAMATAG